MLGGITLTKVVGASTEIAVAGLPCPLPPEMFDVAPATADPSSTQVVTKVSTVAPAFTAAVVRMNSGV